MVRGEEEGPLEVLPVHRKGVVATFLLLQNHMKMESINLQNVIKVLIEELDHQDLTVQRRKGKWGGI